MRRHGWRGAIAAAAAALMAGCGSSSSVDSGEQAKDAAAILADAVQALRQAGPLHLAGDVVSRGMHTQLDLDVAAKDTVKGVFTIDGTRVSITTLRGTTYLAGRDFWNKLDPTGKAANLFGDRCVQLAPTVSGAASILSSVSQLSDLNALADDLAKPRGKVTKGSPTTTAGMNTIPVTDPDSTIYVATEGTPYPLRVETSGAQSGHIDLAYNRSVSITAPPDCLDVGKLTGAG